MVFSRNSSQNVPSLDPQLPLEERVKDILLRMTLEQKVRQLQCFMGEVEGNGIIEKGVGHLAFTLRNYGPKESAAKASQIQRIAREITRLGIPIHIHDEALHGISSSRRNKLSSSYWPGGYLESAADVKDSPSHWPGDKNKRHKTGSFNRSKYSWEVLL